MIFFDWAILRLIVLCLIFTINFLRVKPHEWIIKWYRPKYCIIGVENKSSRFSLKLELFQLFNTNLWTLLSTQDIQLTFMKNKFSKFIAEKLPDMAHGSLLFLRVAHRSAGGLRRPASALVPLSCYRLRRRPDAGRVCVREQEIAPPAAARPPTPDSSAARTLMWMCISAVVVEVLKPRASSSRVVQLSSFHNMCLSVLVTGTTARTRHMGRGVSRGAAAARGWRRRFWWCCHRVATGRDRQRGHNRQTAACSHRHRLTGIDVDVCFAARAARYSRRAHLLRALSLRGARWRSIRLDRRSASDSAVGRRPLAAHCTPHQSTIPMCVTN